MASYIVIEFDTTAPAVEIFAPRYTTNEITTVITVEASESISSYQEFYAIDNQGTRHDYTFHQEEPNSYVGRIRFNNVPLGLITLHARVKDEVDNISNLALATLEVKEHNQLLKMETRFSARGITVKQDEYASVAAKSREAEVTANDREMKTVVADKTRKIDSRIHERKG